MKCPVCHQPCNSGLAKQFVKDYLVSKVPWLVRIWRRLRRFSPSGWPPSGLAR